MKTDKKCIVFITMSDDFAGFLGLLQKCKYFYLKREFQVKKKYDFCIGLLGKFNETIAAKP